MRYARSLALLLAFSMPTPAVGQTFLRVAPEPTPRAAPALPGSDLRDEQDTADQLWRQAREELNRQNYRRAAELFERLIERYPGYANTPDAYYWQAFSLYRTDGTQELQRARQLLDQQRARYPRAATRPQGEQLLVRVRGELAQRGDADAAERVTRDANRAAQSQGCPRDEDADIREAALNSLLQMDAERALPLLKRIMARRDACSAPLRRKAVFMISQKRGAEREELLLDAARNDPDPAVREQAVFWLSQVNSDKAVDAIEDVLNNTNDRKVQERAIFALSQSRSPRAGQILRSWVQGENRPPDLRESAIFWLGQQRNPENARFLRELYARVESEKLKERIIFALSQRRGEGNEQFLMEVALDEKEPIEVRKRALFWASQHRAASVQQLGQLYDRMSNREVRDQIIFSLSQRREPEAVDKLMDIARKEQDRELRKKAIFWLSQSKDPRVAAFLAEIIG